MLHLTLAPVLALALLGAVVLALALLALEELGGSGGPTPAAVTLGAQHLQTEVDVLLYNSLGESRRLVGTDLHTVAPNHTICMAEG